MSCHGSENERKKQGEMETRTESEREQEQEGSRGGEERGREERRGGAESEEVSLKLNIQKIDHGIQSHHFMANRWGNNGNSDGLYFLGLQNRCRW